MIKNKRSQKRIEQIATNEQVFVARNIFFKKIAVLLPEIKTPLQKQGGDKIILLLRKEQTSRPLAAQIS
jgi:hypothetical protein